jgi:hypothetical protein
MELLRWRFCHDIEIRALLRSVANVCCLHSAANKQTMKATSASFLKKPISFRVV